MFHPPKISGDIGWVYVTLFLFYGFGLLFFVLGTLVRDLGEVGLGILLLFGGVYHTIKWIKAKRNDREK